MWEPRTGISQKQCRELVNIWQGMKLVKVEVGGRKRKLKLNVREKPNANYKSAGKRKEFLWFSGRLGCLVLGPWFYCCQLLSSQNKKKLCPKFFR